MRRSRWMALAAVLVVCVGMLGATAVTAGAQSSNEKPKATDVGITATEIHVAVIADVDNPIVPEPVQGLEGRGRRARRSTSTARRAAADSPGARSWSTSTTRSSTPTPPPTPRSRRARTTSPRSARRRCRWRRSTRCATARTPPARPRACPTSRSCPRTLSQQCSDQSFPMAPPQVICSTAIQHPQTFQPNVGRGYYYKQKFGNDLHGVYIFGSDSKSARDSSFASGIGQLRPGLLQVRPGLRHLRLRAAVGLHAGRPGDEERRLELRPGDAGLADRSCCARRPRSRASPA